jgi:hypothetical protein
MASQEARLILRTTLAERQLIRGRLQKSRKTADNCQKMARNWTIRRIRGFIASETKWLLRDSSSFVPLGVARNCLNLRELSWRLPTELFMQMFAGQQIIPLYCDQVVILP